jgi:Rne/Rng family ribonuclease
MSKRKIVVSERDNLATVFEDDQAVEFIINRGSMLLGDVYLATVENILPSIDAAFVNVGGDKMAFLHSSDVHMGKGDLRNRLQPKQQIVVQIMKEPTGHKGPRVTTNISLPGRFLVLMPESKGISISRKIEQPAERSRLKSLVSSVKPQGVGIIIRTEADQQKESDIQEDLETLLERWQNIVSMTDTSKPATLLYRDQDLLYRVIREAVSDEVRELWVDTPFGASRAQQLLSNWNLDRNLKVQQYTGTQSILVAMGVEREIKLALQTKVPLPNGGYLYIQPTEALTVIDVNSGKFTSLQSQAETIRLTNLEAVKEIARQLRLRNIGGMIIIDFIDMESRTDKLQMMESLEEALAPDKAKPQVGQLSDLGLVELTRHRQGQALSEMFTRRCIACNGAGHAMEEFTWAAPSGENRFKPGFNRGGFQQQHGRKPIGHSGANQPNAGNRRFGGNPGGMQQPGNANQGLALKPVLQQITVSLTERPIDTTPLIFKHKQGTIGGANGGVNGDKAEPKIEQPLEDMLKDKLVKTIGTRYASMVQVGITPPEANGIVSRLCPKNTDVLTLLRTLQTTGVVLDDIDDEDMDNFAENGGQRAMSGRTSDASIGAMDDDAGPEDDDDNDDMLVETDETGMASGLAPEQVATGGQREAGQREPGQREAGQRGSAHRQGGGRPRFESRASQNRAAQAPTVEGGRPDSGRRDNRNAGGNRPQQGRGSHGRPPVTERYPDGMIESPTIERSALSPDDASVITREVIPTTNTAAELATTTTATLVMPTTVAVAPQTEAATPQRSSAIRRGRPPKAESTPAVTAAEPAPVAETSASSTVATTPQRRRGRPPKAATPATED